MKGTNLAEWLLRRTTTAEHASAQLGDLLELAQTRGPIWFWRTILATTAYSAARPTVAYLAAIAASHIVGQLWSAYFFRHLDHPLYLDYPLLFSIGRLFTGPLIVVSVFSLIRFGWHDSSTRISLFFALAATISLFYYPSQLLRWTFPALLLATVVLALLQRRSIPFRPLAQLASALAINLTATATLILALLLVFRLSTWFNDPGFLDNTAQAFSRHTFRGVFTLVSYVLEAFVCLLMIRTSNRIRQQRSPS